MRKVFILAGQSNASAYSPLINTRDDRIASPYVPGYAQTALNEWTGAAPASVDTGYQYRYPTLANNPCKYIEKTNGVLTGLVDAWGDYDKCNSTGELGSYGLELAFLQRHRQVYPSVPLGFVKQSLGGTSLRGDWLPNTVTLGTARAGSSTSITLAASDFGTSGAYVGLVMKVTGGTGSGSTGTITAFDASTKVATIGAGWSGTAPTVGSTYGIERLQSQILRIMLAQATTRLNTSDGSGNWEWGGFFWMQGESGAHSAGTAADDSLYLSDSRALFSWVRSLTRSDLKVGVGKIGDNWLNTNPYLVASGVPYTAIDYSITSSGLTVTSQRRADYLAGAYARRATQATLAADTNCFGWNNDGYPVRPPLCLTLANNDTTAYHWGGPGNMAAGERAFTAWDATNAVISGRVHLKPTAGGSGRLRLRVGNP